MKDLDLKKNILKVLSILFLITCPILLYCQESTQLKQPTAEYLDKDTIVITKNKPTKDLDTTTFIVIDDSEIFFSSERGQMIFKNYISKSLNYPDSAIDKKIEGQVIVCFELDSNGKPNKIKIKQSLSPIFDNEVIRVISNLPNYGWTNGIPKTEYRPISLCLPITFKLR